MLRRAPTALTLSPADVADFERLHAVHVAHAEYLRTGHDGQRLFGAYSDAEIRSPGFVRRLLAEQQQQSQAQTQAQTQDPSGGYADPSDELKPLPGDKARIVRGRDERIMGGGR